MSAVPEYVVEDDQIITVQVMDDLGRFAMDPLGFVFWAFPWGQDDLKGKKVEQWQAKLLEKIGTELRAGAEFGAVVRKAIRAGHGVGKSALVAWIVLWAIMTFEEARGVVTANTDTQLRTKTWPEVTKWFNRCIARPWFSITATAIFSKDPVFEKNWRIDAVPWSKSNPAAFAGLHNAGKRVLMVFDEASEIDNVIWETAEGVMTDELTQAIFCAFGNATTTLGRFAELWTRFRDIWDRDSIDSREVSFTNKALIQEWLETYGEDSDFFRVRVRGLPPRAGSTSFLAPELITAAMKRRLELREYMAHPKLLGVDVARYGDDSTVFTIRQHTKVHKQIIFKGLDTTEVAGRALDTFRVEQCAMVFVDGTGLGAGVVDQLAKAGIPVTDVVANTTATDDRTYHSVRDECAGRMKELLPSMDIPDEADLQAEMEAIEYGFDARMRVQLIAKKDMKRLRGMSPDRFDSLCLTFMPVASAAPKRVQAAPVKRRKVVM